MEGQFTKLNESFTCLNCGKFVEKDLNGSSRNHCNFCLCSVHLDITPGDRLSQCHGRMFPIDIISIGGKNIIFHKCSMCNIIKKNKALIDDNLMYFYEN